MFLKDFIIDDINKQQQLNGQSQVDDNQNQKTKGDVIIRNRTYTKNLGTNQAQYDLQEVDFNSILFDNENENKDQLRFQLQTINSTNSMNQPEIVDFEQCRASIEEGCQERDQQQQLKNQEVLEQEIPNQNTISESEQEQVQNEEIAFKSEDQNFEVLNFTEIQIPEQNKVTPSKPYSEIIRSLDQTDYMGEFLVTPLRQPGMLQCIIRRESSGLNSFKPKYKLYWQEKKQFLISARKELNKHKYKLSQDPDFSSKFDAALIGSVEQSKQSKADYFLFDNGVKTNKEKHSIINTKPRVQLGGVFFETNQSGLKQPRKMMVLLKQNGNENQITTFENRQPVLKKQFDCTQINNNRNHLHS
ncbi:unnamed protein product (macronuclear) [Paramecium tetraurelia]|uniref:Tubby C-terminal domain-containing protein n=1 Tax=Paramecium tetraurelia TaxID=5888 RepID=A0DQZ1_PARTE|nr:uncharacterized protein GSPATT00002859001 [Paramecium tetraurelia]CAK85458.1 unnamed protein product [Paramecium tetraurelia]|eukprot:XP_001452855.1 hypothetical protein (macronuclear) [Paramecium tetraurelia strain d4-2]